MYVVVAGSMNLLQSSDAAECLLNCACRWGARRSCEYAATARSGSLSAEVDARRLYLGEGVILTGSAPSLKRQARRTAAPSGS
jgi:hypothetical protein